MQGITKPVLIIYPRKTEFYPSIKAAALSTGISRWRLERGLKSSFGEIPGTHPVLYIDEAVVPKDESDKAE